MIHSCSMTSLIRMLRSALIEAAGCLPYLGLSQADPNSRDSFAAALAASAVSAAAAAPAAPALLALELMLEVVVLFLQPALAVLQPSPALVV